MSLTDHRQAMAEMYAQGYSMGEIAEQFGTSRQRVHQLIAGTYKHPHWGQRRQERYENNLRAAHARICAGETSVREEAARMEIQDDSLRAAMRRFKLQLPDKRPPSPEHGTYYRYQEGCRCPECRAAQRAYVQKLRARGPRIHGTASAYRNFACRCDACKAAGAIANRNDYLKRKRRRREAVPLD